MKKKHFYVATLLFTMAVFSIFSCKKQTESNVATDTNKIEKLATQFNQPVSANYQSLVSEFQNLNEDDLNLFWAQMGKIYLDKGTLSVNQESNYLMKMKQFNDESKKIYHKAFNQLNATEIKEITYPGAGQHVGIANKIDPPPPPGDCPFYYYTFFYTIFSGETASPPSIQRQDVKQYSGDGYGVCNAVEYVYSGTQWTNMYPISAMAAWIMGTPNSWPWNVRQVGGLTYVYAPKSFVINAFGSLDNFDDNVRLCRHFSVDE